jgi:predicted Zn-dependent protease
VNLPKSIAVIVASSSIILFSQCSQLPPTSDDFRSRLSQISATTDSREDVEAEVKFGRAVAARFLGQYDADADNELQRYTNTLGQYLAQFSGRGELDFHFLVIDEKDVNAYAMPGGYIFVTTGAIAMMQNEAEFAGVLSHEIAHVVEKHVVNALDIKGRSSTALISQFAAGTSDAYRVALSQATEAAFSILTEDGLQVGDEYNADEMALLIMTQAGYEPSSYLSFLQRLNQSATSQHLVLSKTHPALDDRLARLEQAKISNGLENLDYAVLEERFLTFKP